ncbi:hypothetical protein EDD21DRAFT_411778 [Dissophora ornata]|nr:hypothetical protein BGZ58_005328 [Dissophora ornata]KAI8604778.1 hypothetical protein EDD21DRAFT_411778 [Dissophora ornata]
MAFNAVLIEFPTRESVADDLAELMSVLGETCSYELFQDRVLNVAPNTPICHFLERQAMLDLLRLFIRGALLVYDIESEISEIAIIGSGVRKNIGKEASDKLSKCRLADITGNDVMGNQVLHENGA